MMRPACGREVVAPANELVLDSAALIAIRPGCRPRLICRVHRARGKDRRKGFTEAGYAALLDAAHRQLGGPLAMIWDNLKCATRRCGIEWR